MFHFISRKTISTSVFMLLLSQIVPVSYMSGHAQETDKPLDLTVLSTNEESVSFVVVEQNTSASQDALSSQDDVERMEKSDNQTDLARTVDNESEAQAQTPTDLVSNEEEQNQNDDVSQEDESKINLISETQEVQEQSNIDEPATGRMTKRKIKDVGLASIGIGIDEAKQLDQFTNRLWRGIPVDRAMRLIEIIPADLSSDALRQMSYQAIARQGVPPKGAADNPTALLQARMDYLARTGRSDALASIVKQLPKNDEWQSWHEWKIFYDLMMRQDDEACATAAENASTSLDPLWQKTNLMCQILTGDEMRASFSADVLKASGLIDDPLYFDLIDLLLGRANMEDVQSRAASVTTLDFMHVILMDAAHVEISATQIANLEPSYREAAGALRYLSDEARQSLGLSNLQSGLMSRSQAKALFIASTTQNDTALMAMSRRLEAQDNKASTPLYLAIRNEVANANGLSADELREFVTLIMQAMQLEMSDHKGALWLPFYAPLLSEAVAAADITTLDADLQYDFALLMRLANLPLSPLPSDGTAVVQADHLSIVLDATASLADRTTSMLALGLEVYLPLLGMSEADNRDWFAIYDEQTASQNLGYQPLSEAGMMALKQAAAKGQKVETIILASRLIDGRLLSDISPQNMDMMIQQLAQAGLPNTAAALADEALRAHVMQALFHPEAAASL